MSLIVTANQLTKTFGVKKAVNAIDLKIEKGPPVGLVGPNGAGKTTLFSLIAGFLRPSSGSVTIFGHSPTASQVKGRLAILPQDASFVKGISIIANISFLCKLQGFTGKAAMVEAERVLELVNMSEHRNQHVERLSHGMYKRVAIAQAFIGTPELVLLDEPTAGLDPPSAKKIHNLIRANTDRTSFIISSHNLNEIEDICSSVIIIKDGAIVSHDALSNLVSRSNVLRLRLETEPSETLIQTFKQHADINEVKNGRAGENVLILYYAERENLIIETEVLQILNQLGLSYLELKRGEALDDKVSDFLEK